MYFLSISFRNLWRRPIRSCLTAMGVAVAVATLIEAVRWLDWKSLGRIIERNGTVDPSVRTGDRGRGRGGIQPAMG